MRVSSNRVALCAIALNKTTPRVPAHPRRTLAVPRNAPISHIVRTSSLKVPTLHHRPKRDLSMWAGLRPLLHKITRRKIGKHRIDLRKREKGERRIEFSHRAPRENFAIGEKNRGEANNTGSRRLQKFNADTLQLTAVAQSSSMRCRCKVRNVAARPALASRGERDTQISMLVSRVISKLAG